jgi:uncharacterized lipoprotein YmbA
MTRAHRWIGRSLLALTASIGLASCAVSDPTQFYALSRAAAPRASTASASIAMSSVDGAGIGGIGVGPVIVPGYLDRNQIVIRTGTDQVQISAFHRWAEPLEDGIARVLAEELAARVPTERVVVFPWRGVVARSIQYQVVVAVVRFDGRQGGDVTLDARWRVLASNGSELAFQRSTVIQGVEGSGYEPMIAAMDRALGILGQEIAAEIRALPRGEEARR